MAKQKAGGSKSPARQTVTPGPAQFALLQQQTVGMKNPTAAAPGGLRPEDAGDGLSVAGRDIKEVLAAGEDVAKRSRIDARKTADTTPPPTIATSIEGAKRANFKPAFLQPPALAQAPTKPNSGVEKQTYSKTGKEHSAAQIAAYQNRSKRS